MLVEHVSADHLARIFTTAVLVVLGLLQIAKPGCFWGLYMYFWGARAAFDPQQRERLDRVLDARERAEGNVLIYSRYAGALTILLAPLALVPAVPYVLPYAASCLAMAVAMLFAYLRFRRAAERRVAPLARRSVWAA